MIFKCPICLNNAEYNEGKKIQLSETAEYLICSQCHEIIMKIRNDKGEKQ